MPAGLTSRSERMRALRDTCFDLLVIGGGITGCGIARDAALRGLSVALVEKNDFGSGTSSRSSRLVHGGVRYLEHGYLHLVFEASAERRRLLALAPHLVRPLLFTWPVYRGARIPRWKLRLGLMLYDALALFRNVGRHHALSRDATLREEPRLRDTGLRGGASYFDAATSDVRLTLANALGALASGAVVANHVAVTALTVDTGRVAGATVCDALTGECFDVRAAVVVNATGPWSDDIRRLDGERGSAVRGSKGVHVAVPRDRIGNVHALTLVHPRDGRVVFVLPAGEHAIIGTTDTYTNASPDEVRASIGDVAYLLDAANTFFPGARLTESDVVSAWAGIRPLVPASGSTPGSASREHAVTMSPTGLVSITGGKLTTYRVMAHDVLEVVLEKLGRSRSGDPTASAPLPGGAFSSIEALADDAARATSDVALAAHLVATYGSEWPAVWQTITASGGSERIEPWLAYTIGEVQYHVECELACTLADILIRRTHVAFETRDHGVGAAARVAQIAARSLGWNAGRIRAELDAYTAEVSRIFAIEA